MRDYNRNNALPGAGYCGPRGRRLLNLAYSIAFVCLLRIDEVLRIEHRHITLLPNGKLEINLDYRKTSQFGREFFYKYILLLIIHRDTPFYSSTNAPGDAAPLCCQCVCSMGFRNSNCRWICLSKVRQL